MKENSDKLKRCQQYCPPQSEDYDGEDADDTEKDDLVVVAAVLQLPVYHLFFAYQSPSKRWDLKRERERERNVSGKTR